MLIQFLQEAGTRTGLDTQDLYLSGAGGREEMLVKIKEEAGVNMENPELIQIDTCEKREESQKRQARKCCSMALRNFYQSAGEYAQLSYS